MVHIAVRVFSTQGVGFDLFLDVDLQKLVLIQPWTNFVFNDIMCDMLLRF